MNINTHIQFRHLEPSAAVERDVRNHISVIGRFDPRITDCKVIIEAPHKHQHKGRHYKVTIIVTLPGDTIVVSHGDDGSTKHEDCYAAIHDAFKSARRQIQDRARIRRHEVKYHYPNNKQELRGRIDETGDS